MFPEMFNLREQEGPRLQIPASPVYMPCFLIAYQNKDGRVFVTDGKDQAVELIPGSYSVEVVVVHEARTDVNARRFEVAGETMRWI